MHMAVEGIFATDWSSEEQQMELSCSSADKDRLKAAIYFSQL